MAEGTPVARAWRKFAGSDIYYSFRTSRITVAAAIVTAIIFAACFAAPLIAIQDPYDPANLDLGVAMRPPVFWGGGWDFPPCSAPTIRAATCIRPSSTARGSR